MKTTQIMVRLSEAESRLWRENAWAAGRTLSSWVRDICNRAARSEAERKLDETLSGVQREWAEEAAEQDEVEDKF